MSTDDTDLDALIEAALKLLHIEAYGGEWKERPSVEVIRTAIPVLRARLAPTTHADDEAKAAGAIINAPATLPLHLRKTGTEEEDRLAVEAFEHGVVQRIVGGGPPENRAGLYNINRRRIDAHIGRLRARAEAAEAALKECRDKTIEECAAVADGLLVTGTVPIDPELAGRERAHLIGLKIRALKAKEPRDA